MNSVKLNAAALVALWASAAFSGDWFVHKYGELRSYHGDWLAICENVGKGDCRVKQTLLAPNQKRVGPNVVTIHIREDQGSLIVT